MMKPRNRTKVEKAEHARYTQVSTDKKRAAGLDRVSLWVPAGQKATYKEAAQASVARYLSKETGTTCDLFSKPLAGRTATPRPKTRRNQPGPRQMAFNLGC